MAKKHNSKTGTLTAIAFAATLATLASTPALADYVVPDPVLSPDAVKPDAALAPDQTYAAPALAGITQPAAVRHVHFCHHFPHE